MTFAAPWMLVGLLAVGVPIWLHLRRLRDAAVPFPALLAVSKVAKRRAPRIRFRKVLLLILRCLLLVLLVLASARPAVTLKRPGGIRRGSSLALVLVLDNSMSMRLRGANGESLFESAKILAATELDRLRPGDAAALVLTCPAPDFAIPAVEFDLVKTQKTLEEAQPTFRRGQLKETLLTALEILERSPLTQREVLLITDLSEGEHMERLPPWSPGTGISLRILDAGPEVRRANLAVESVRAGPSPEGTAEEVLIEAKVANHSSTKAKALEVILEVDQAEVARGSLDIPANASAVKRFYHRFKGDGVYRGAVRIPGDQLLEDDIRHFSIVVSHTVSVLIIDGDYRPGTYADEAFYLLKALETPTALDSPVAPTVLDMETALNTSLTGYDVVILAGVRDLTATLADRIIEYVREGGGLLVSPNDKGSELGPIESILPAKVRSVQHASRAHRPFSIGPVHRSHPIFEPFAGEPTGLESTEIWSHLLVEPDPSVEKTTLIETRDGLPLLLERRVERGRVMLLGTTVDRAWSDLPIRPGFLPLMKRAVRHLSGRLEDRAPKRVEAGEPVMIEVNAGMQRLTVRGPNDRDTVFTAQELDGQSSVEFRNTDLPGAYAVWAKSPKMGGLMELPHLGFTVETNTLESNPARKIAASADDAEDRFAPMEGSLPVWPYLLIAVFILFLLETAVAGSGLRRSHMQRKARKLRTAKGV